MAVNYAYNYAEVDNVIGMCVGIITTGDPDMDGWVSGIGTTYVAIPVYDPEYLMKYYINGNWYEDAEGTIPWQSSLL